MDIPTNPLPLLHFLAHHKNPLIQALSLMTPPSATHAPSIVTALVLSRSTPPPGAARVPAPLADAGRLSATPLRASAAWAHGTPKGAPLRGPLEERGRARLVKPVPDREGSYFGRGLQSDASGVKGAIRAPPLGAPHETATASETAAAAAAEQGRTTPLRGPPSTMAAPFGDACCEARRPEKDGPVEKDAAGLKAPLAPTSRSPWT